MEKYKKLVNNEVTFLVPKTENEYLIKEFKYLAPYADDEYDSNEYKYLFFDFDNDSIPELCVSDDWNKYFFKYVAETDRYILSFEGSGYWLIGSLKVNSIALGTGQAYYFYILNAQQQEDCMVFFFFKPAYNEELGDSEVVYVAGLPNYCNDKEQIDIPEEIKAQAYYCRSQGVYYFRVTEDQFELLTEEYRKARNLSEEKILEVTFTYNQLFGD